MGKQVIKISAEEFITSKYHYDEIATLNVTRGERIAMVVEAGKRQKFVLPSGFVNFKLLPRKKNRNPIMQKSHLGCPYD
jgi:hypothetical protein